MSDYQYPEESSDPQNQAAVATIAKEASEPPKTVPTVMGNLVESQSVQQSSGQLVTMASIIRNQPSPIVHTLQATLPEGTSTVPSLPVTTGVRPMSMAIRKPGMTPIRPITVDTTRPTVTTSNGQTVQITIHGKSCEPHRVVSSAKSVHINQPRSATSVSTMFSTASTISPAAPLPVVMSKSARQSFTAVSQPESSAVRVISSNSHVSTSVSTLSMSNRLERSNLIGFSEVPSYGYSFPTFQGPVYSQGFPSVTCATASPSIGSQSDPPVNLAVNNQPVSHGLPGTSTVKNHMVVSGDPSRQSTTTSEVSTLPGNAVDDSLNVVTFNSLATSALSPVASHIGPNASPRANILRKRTIEGSIVRRTITTPTGSETGSPRPESTPRSATNSPKQVGILERDANSQSSTDTATSDGLTSLNSSMDATKTEAGDPIIDSSCNMCSVQSSMESSPRKKPRKQLLNVSEELKDHRISTDDETEVKESIADEAEKEEDKEEYVDQDGIHWVAMRKRYNSALLSSFNIHWKSRNNHFLRHSDVKPKEERRSTVNELSNQKGIQQRANGWKLYHLSSQLEDVKSMEMEALDHFTEIQDSIKRKISLQDEGGNRIHELVQANRQRLKLVIDQIDEARNSLIKILEHKIRIQEIINKYHSKRQVKKKERA